MPVRRLLVRPNLDQLKHQARAEVDADGVGGQTALFNSVVSQAAFWMNYGSAGHGDTRLREFRDVTPLSWGERFAPEQVPIDTYREILFVNQKALRVLEAEAGADR